MAESVTRLAPDKEIGYVHQLELTKAAVSAAYHCLVSTKVKKSTRKNHSRVMKAMKRSTDTTISCMFAAESEAARAQQGDWVFRAGCLRLTTDSFDYLKDSADALLNGEGVPGHLGEGYDDLLTEVERVALVRAAAEKAKDVEAAK